MLIAEFVRWEYFTFTIPSGIYYIRSSNDNVSLQYAGGPGVSQTTSFYYKDTGSKLQFFIKNTSGYLSVLSLSGEPIIGTESSESVSSLTELTPQQ